MDLCFTKAIPGAIGYLITRDGRVISLTRRVKMKNGGLHFVEGKILIPFDDNRGYLQVTLGMDNGISKRFKIHRLVAQAFIPNPDNLPVVEHDNDIKTDNREVNLKWSTYAINNQNAYDRGLKVGAWLGKKGSDHPNSKKIQQIKDGEIIKTYVNAREATLDGFCYKHISDVALGRRNHHKGFQWRYCDTDKK